MNTRAGLVVATMSLLTVILLGSSLGGCDLLQEETDQEPGTLNMLITDKPFPFEFIAEATVTITRVEVRAGDHSDDDQDDEANNDNESDASDDADDDEGDEDDDQADDNDNESDDNDDSDEEADDDSDDDDGGGSTFVTVMDAESSFNLLELQNGITAQLLSSSLPAGSYGQVRLIVSSGKIVLNDGREFELNVPSGEQTGIKLNFHFEIEPDQDTTLLLDVDLSKAFKPVPAGQIDDPSQIEMFQFSPSLAVRITEVGKTGTISGQVRDEQGSPLADVSVTAFRDGQEVTTTATAADGSFSIVGLEPGDYQVEFSSSGFDDQALPAISVAAGQDSPAGIVALVAQTAGP